jgi:RNA polymerase-binding transcription factor DksA
MLKTTKFKDRLVEEKERLERMIRARHDSATQHGAVGINDAFSNSGDDEYADSATETFYQELDMTMVNKYRDRLDRVKAALSRVDNGTYGTCIRCHTQISEARLEAIPETPYCRDCEADVEVQD